MAELAPKFRITRALAQNLIWQYKRDPEMLARRFCKEELHEEKVEKIRLSRQVLDSQLAGSDSTQKEMQKVLMLEQQAIASVDVLQHQQKNMETLEGRLNKTVSELSDAETAKQKLESQRVQLQAELHGLQAESAEWREREDELNMQLLNAVNGRAAAEAVAEELTASLEAKTLENERVLDKAEAARSELQEARAEAATAGCKGVECESEESIQG